MDPRVGLDSPLSMFLGYFLADLVGVVARTTRPRRGDKTPASFADYAVIESGRCQTKKRGRPPKKRVAEVQPGLSLRSSNNMRRSTTTFLLLPYGLKIFFSQLWPPLFFCNKRLSLKFSNFRNFLEFWCCMSCF